MITAGHALLSRVVPRPRTAQKCIPRVLSVVSCETTRNDTHDVYLFRKLRETVKTHKISVFEETIRRSEKGTTIV